MISETIRDDSHGKLEEISCGLDSVPAAYIRTLKSGSVVVYMAHILVSHSREAALKYVSRESKLLPSIFHDSECELSGKKATE